MKKRIISIALLVISFVFALLLASCGKGNERTEVVFIEKPDRYESCEHNWQMKSQTLATCVSEGKITMSCTLCRKVNTVSTPKTECEYNTYWEWHYNSLPRIHFECPLNYDHTYSVQAIYISTNVEQSCIQRGAEIRTATLYHKGETYTDTYIFDKGLGDHSYKSTYELLAFNCEDGIKRTDTCTVCSDVQESIEYSHRLLNEETVYSFDELGLCAGGSITQRVCLCGEMRSDKYIIYRPGCTVTRNENVVHNGTIDYYSITDVCSDCSFTYKFDGAATHNSTDRYMYAYKINTYTLTEDITLTDEAFDNSAHDLFEHQVEYTYNMIDNRWEHEQTATCTECLYKHKKQASHSMSYSYEPLGKTCLDGTRVTKLCRDCGYSEEYVTYNHTTSSVKESYNLESYGFCQGEIVLEVCYCGYERLSPRGVHWYSQRKSEKKEETDTSVLIKKTEECSKCGFSIETIDERTLIDGAWYKTGIITNIYLDEETTLTSRKDIFKLHSGIPLPDEEIPKAIEELEALLNDASCTLDDDMRRILTYYLEDLKNRQAN
ncbi:MAG: hypothetical protein IJC80_04620 [Clostridia bacterium]|nr:hypothetical protein [Clostridia bacterium]